MAQQNEKMLTEWSIQETMQYLGSSIGDKQRKANKLFQAVQYLASKLDTEDNIVEILSSGGLDLVFDLMADTLEMDNCNFQKGLCTILIVACSHAASKQYAAKKNGFNALANQLSKYMEKDSQYCIYVNNAVCNVCHNNDKHRDYAINSEIVSQIIAAMDAHRGFIYSNRTQKHKLSHSTIIT